MKRKEEIEKQADLYTDNASNYVEWGNGWEDYDDVEYIEKAFVAGAKWADKTMLDKVCKWLKENIDDYFTTGEGEFEEWFDSVYEDLRQAMEGE